jgi:hypothetical protein
MSGHTHTHGGGASKKWVGLNYKEKKKAKEANSL